MRRTLRVGMAQTKLLAADSCSICSISRVSYVEVYNEFMAADRINGSDVRFILPFLLAGIVTSFLTTASIGIEHLQISVDGQRRSVDGKVVVEAADGGVLLLARDGRMWALPPTDIVSRTSDETEFKHLAKKEFQKEIQSQLPQGFQVHRTAHYLVFFNTSRAYAQWCGSLYERLYRAFLNFWRQRGLSLETPATPLVAIIFDDRQQYMDFSHDELQGAANNVVGYYSMKTNWMTTFDLTGLESVRRPGARAKTRVVVNQILSQPAAAPNVATIVHEATHQIAFNCGLQNRYADNPLWLSEGLALFFEVPDLRNTKGWRRIGAVNQPRLAEFQQTHARRSVGSLKRLLLDDRVLREPNTAITAYAESWALCYFLIKRRESQFVEYLKEIGEKPHLVYDSPNERFATFQKHFGSFDQLWEDFSSFLATGH